MDQLRPILYAEDNENDIELALAAFRYSRIPNRIDVVRDGQQVMDYLTYSGKYQDRDREMPAVILLDVKMPRMDGIQTLRFIRTSANLKLLPVVMLTSSTMESDIADCYSLGANAYVVKPVDFDEFRTAIKSITQFWLDVNVGVG